MTKDENRRSPIDMILDEDNTENITLYNERGDAVEFEQIAVIDLEGETYVILKPDPPVEGMDEDEALVFVIDEYEGENTVVVVEDDDIVDAVFEEYYRMLEEYN